MSEVNQQPKSVKPKMPKIRFEGFNTFYDSIKMIEMDVNKKFSNGVFNDPAKVGTGYKLINVLNMYETPYISYEKLTLLDLTREELLKNQVHKGDVFFTRSSLVKEGIAWNNVYLDDYDDVTFDGHLIKLSMEQQKYKPIYFHYNFRSDLVRKQIISVSKTGSMTTIGQADLASIQIFYPSIEEQIQIGNFFQELDKLIELQTRTVELAETHKKAMLQKMFPQKGEKVPKVRFEGFSGDWELYNLNDLVKINMGQSPDSENYTDNPEDKILVQGNADLDRGKVIPRIYTTQITKVAEKGDIILTVRAPVGAIAITDFDVVLGRGVAAIKGNRFIYYTLELFNLIGSWLRFSSGSTFDSVNSNEIKQMPVMAPDNEEQAKIGNYFQELDQNIESEKQKLEQYQTMKRAMLQRMFV